MIKNKDILLYASELELEKKTQVIDQLSNENLKLKD